MFISFPNTNASAPTRRKTKRDSALVFLVLESDGTVSITNSCTNAVEFFLSNGTLTSNGLHAQVTLANVTTGLADFTFGPDNSLDIETTFSVPGDVLTWSNGLFTGGQAIFAFPLSGEGFVVVVFNGIIPAGYAQITLSDMILGGAAANSGKYAPHMSFSDANKFSLCCSAQLDVFCRASLEFGGGNVYNWKLSNSDFLRVFTHHGNC
jgi:hypothetical protein